MTVKSAQNEVIQVQEYVRNGYVNWFKILVSGVEQHSQFVWPESTEDLVQYERDRILVKVKELKSEIDYFTIEQIKSGEVQSLLSAYDLEYRASKQELQDRANKPIWETIDKPRRPQSVFSDLDFGQYSESMDLESKIELYKKIGSAVLQKEYQIHF